MDRNNFSQYIDPKFARYNTQLAKAMTDWLYRDPKSNPTWNKPELWAAGARVQIVKRTLAFESLAPSGGASTQKLSLVGGKNAIVFSRSATITKDAVSEDILPNTLGGYVQVEQRRTDGFLEIEQQPLNTAYGTVPGWPDMPPAPEFWVGNSDRVITVTNNWNAIVTVRLSWQVALLDTAR